nr:hypothetical protein GCM10020093_116810 [Planobispora longispora]
MDEPVAEVTLAQVLERPTHEVAAALRELSAEYTATGRGFDLREVAGGWRFYTRAECASSWSGSSATASRRGSPRPPWRPWPWSPTGSP